MDLREYPELIEQINRELQAHNVVELKREVDRRTGEERFSS